MSSATKLKLIEACHLARVIPLVVGTAGIRTSVLGGPGGDAKPEWTWH